jgi:hypothetical protein
MARSSGGGISSGRGGGIIIRGVAAAEHGGSEVPGGAAERQVSLACSAHRAVVGRAHSSCVAGCVMNAAPLNSTPCVSDRWPPPPAVAMRWGSCRQRPAAGPSRSTLTVRTSDGEWFPVKRKLLRPCIALTKAVRLEAEGEAEVSVDVDTCTFDRWVPGWLGGWLLALGWGPGTAGAVCWLLLAAPGGAAASAGGAPVGCCSRLMFTGLGGGFSVLPTTLAFAACPQHDTTYACGQLARSLPAHVGF